GSELTFSHAAWSGPSASRSTSPCRATRGTDSSRRASALNGTAAIGAASFRKMKHEFERVRPFVAELSEVVDHVADEEETPTPRRLQAGQLQVQVGGRRVRDNVGAAVDDPDHEFAAVHGRADGDRQLRV